MQDQLKRICAARLAMAENNVYTRAISELEMQIKELEVGRDRVIKENWEDLKNLRKG